MGIFGFTKEKDEYDAIYDTEMDYSELDENEEPEEVIDRLKGVIGRGDCLYCKAKDGMKYDGFICFVCSECGKTVHEDLYYRWAAGYPIEVE